MFYIFFHTEKNLNKHTKTPSHLIQPCDMNTGYLGDPKGRYKKQLRILNLDKVEQKLKNVKKLKKVMVKNEASVKEEVSETQTAEVSETEAAVENIPRSTDERLDTGEEKYIIRPKRLKKDKDSSEKIKDSEEDQNVTISHLPSTMINFPGNLNDLPFPDVIFDTEMTQDFSDTSEIYVQLAAENTNKTAEDESDTLLVDFTLVNRTHTPEYLKRQCSRTRPYKRKRQFEAKLNREKITGQREKPEDNSSTEEGQASWVSGHQTPNTHIIDLGGGCSYVITTPEALNPPPPPTRESTWPSVDKMWEDNKSTRQWHSSWERPGACDVNEDSDEEEDEVEDPVLHKKSGESGNTRLLRGRIKELEQEVARLKAQNDSLWKEKKEREKKTSSTCTSVKGQPGAKPVSQVGQKPVLMVCLCPKCKQNCCAPPKAVTSGPRIVNPPVVRRVGPRKLAPKPSGNVVPKPVIVQAKPPDPEPLIGIPARLVGSSKNSAEPLIGFPAKFMGYLPANEKLTNPDIGNCMYVAT